MVSQMWNRLFPFIMLFILTVGLIVTGCNKEQGIMEEEQLTVGLYDHTAADFDELRSKYTLQFERKHPHIQLDFISAIRDPYHLYRYEQPITDRIDRLDE